MRRAPTAESGAFSLGTGGACRVCFRRTAAIAHEQSIRQSARVLMWRRAQLIVMACALISVSAVAAAPSLLSQLAGRYSHKFKNGDVSGATYDTTDVVKVHPLDRTRALISFELNFFNGHSCGVYGVAKLEGAKLVYRDRAEWRPDEPDCELRIWRDRTKLRWEDGGSCQFHCGARGGLSNGEISLSSRRAILTKPEPPLP